MALEHVVPGEATEDAKHFHASSLIGPAVAVPSGPAPATPEESCDIIKVACLHVVLEAERVGQRLEDLAPRCKHKYGRGAFSVHFASLASARRKECLSLEEWLNLTVRRSSSYPFPSNGPVPTKVLDAARAFSCDCATEGQLGRRVIYRKAEKLLDQLPLDGSEESRQALKAYDPLSDVCICGEVSVGVNDDIFTVVARVPLEVLSKKQREQSERWSTVREHVARLKSWGNDELSDREVGVELAAKTYREALRILLESELEDAALEIPLRLNLAEALARLGQWAESSEECASALALEPQNAKALFRRGRALLRLGRGDEARVELERAARVMPGDRLIRNELEAARLWVPPPPTLPSHTGGSAVGSRCSQALRAPRKGMDIIWGLLARLAPGLWRQMLLCMLCILAFNGVSRFRRRR